MADPTRQQRLEEIERRSAECQADLSARTKSLRMLIEDIEQQDDELNPDGSLSTSPEFVQEEDSLVHSVDALQSLVKNGSSRR